MHVSQLEHRALQDAVDVLRKGVRQPSLNQGLNTTTTTQNDTIVLFALDAMSGPKRNIRVEFWLNADAAATFTPSWNVTREGAVTTFVAQALPAIATIVTPASAARYRYELGDLPEGAQAEFRVAQNNLGAATVAIDGVMTYEGRD